MNDNNQQDIEPFLAGLSSGVAAQRLQTEGLNELGIRQRRAMYGIVRDVLKEPMFLLLLVAGGIYLVMGDRGEALTLLGFVTIIIGITVFQERRTDNALAALRDLSSPRALVIRDGQQIRISGRELVREDCLVLAEGDRVPADARLLSAHELATDESMLSGESVAVGKAPGDSVYAGTLVVAGQGMAIITATGGHTEMGRIGQSLEDIQLQTSPLREEMNRLTRRLAVIGVLLSLLLIALFWWMRGSWLEGILAGIGLAMALLPQELSVIMIVFFALAARRLAIQQVLTRRLHAIESLGETTVLCVDKTGTLTQNRMQVAALSVPGQRLMLPVASNETLPEGFRELLDYAVLASEIQPHDPMEQAFHRLADTQPGRSVMKKGSWKLSREYELSPALLAMTHGWHSGDADDIVAAKGAPEAIALLCKLNNEQHMQAMKEAESLASQGLRVLAVARALHPADQPWPERQDEFGFEWLGLVALADPLREEVPSAIAQCVRAGIRVVMITGDHPRTALAIARQAGLSHEDMLSGDDLLRMDPAVLAAHAARVNVFARVKPQQKLALVEALKARGEIVAMTGDGVNDAPALKAAHIGIAMGQRGTDVAREAASLVLLRDDFASIVEAIRMGRRTYANMRQAMVYTLAVHVPIAGLAMLPVLFGLPLLLAPLHIAFLELVIDPACSLVFEAEKGPDDLMSVPPRSTRETLLSAALVTQSLLYGGVTTLMVFVFYYSMLRGDSPGTASAATFVMLVTANAALILPVRSALASRMRVLCSLTPTAWWVLAATTAALLLVICWTPLASAFRFEMLSASEWVISMACGMAMLPWFVLIKRLSTY